MTVIQMLHVLTLLEASLALVTKATLEMERLVPVSTEFNIKLLMILQSLDINECTEVGMNDCDSNATCTDIVGSFTCTCNQGYTGNGTTCTSEYRI